MTPFSDVNDVTPGLMVAAKYNDLLYRGVVRTFGTDNIFEVSIVLRKKKIIQGCVCMCVCKLESNSLHTHLTVYFLVIFL